MTNLAGQNSEISWSTNALRPLLRTLCSRVAPCKTCRLLNHLLEHLRSRSQRRHALRDLLAHLFHKQWTIRHEDLKRWRQQCVQANLPSISRSKRDNGSFQPLDPIYFPRSAVRTPMYHSHVVRHDLQSRCPRFAR